MRGAGSWFSPRRGAIALLGGVTLPLVAAAVLVPFRTKFADAAAALVLVTVVALVATLGTRLAGYVASVSASLWFDFFLTRPYDQVVITHQTDIEITVSLLLVGIAITEMAARSRRHYQRAEEEASHVELLYHVAELVASGASFDEVMGLVRTSLIELLHLRDCRFELGPGGESTGELQRDGRVVLGAIEWPVRVWGWPGRELVLPILDRGRAVGRLVLIPTPSEPVSLQRRLVAVALVDQLGSLVVLHRRSA